MTRAAKLRLLFVRNLYWPEDFGGNRYPLEVTSRLARRGHAIRVVTGNPVGTRPRSDETLGVDIHYFPVRRGHPLATHLTNAFASRGEVSRSLREFAPEVALVSSYDVGLTYFARRQRPPTAFSYHSSFRSDAVERLKSRPVAGKALHAALRMYVAWLERHVMRSADRIIAVSDFSEREIRHRVPEAADRIVRIPTGVDTSFFVPGDRQLSRTKLEVSVDDVVLVVVGRLVPVKRYDRAIDTLARVRARGHRAVLLIVGEGPERSRLEKHAESAGVAGSVRFLGFRTGSALREVLTAADLQLCTSEFENLSLALLEGMSVGIPVISVPTGGTVGLLSQIDRDLLAYRVDAESLAARVDEWLRQPERRLRTAQAVRAHAVSEYDWETVVSRLEAELTTLAESNAAARTGRPD